MSANWIVRIASLIAAALLLQAKSIDYTPEITSRSYWDAHHIASVRVTAVMRDERDRQFLVYRVETPFSSGPIEPAGTIAAADLWFADRAEASRAIAVDDRLALFYAKDEPGMIAAVRLDNAAGENRLIEALGQIAMLYRNREDLQGLRNGVFSADPAVARYSLRSLLEQPSTPADPDYRSKLLRLRDSEQQTVQVRLLAGRLASRLDGQPDRSDTEYSWLMTAISSSQSPSWKELAPLVDRLLEFDTRRAQSVGFLTELATDAAARPAVRIAAYGAFEDPRLFRFEAPDVESGRIFQACISMLHDRGPDVRAAGAAVLHNITTSIRPEDRAAFVKRSQAAIADVLQVERDPTARHHLSYFLNQLSQ